MSSFDVYNLEVTSQVTASGSTCAEIPVDSTSRDGLLINNQDSSLDIFVTLVPRRLTTVYTTAQAFALRVIRIAPNTTEQIGVKGETRVLVSSAAGTPAFAYQEYKS